MSFFPDTVFMLQQRAYGCYRTTDHGKTEPEVFPSAPFRIE
jgi:hypothetical protein